MSASRHWARRLLMVAAAAVAAAGLVEGLPSWGLFAVDTLGELRVAERAHTAHDPELGWVSRPGLDLPDHYGPGIGLSTTRLGARGAEIGAAPPLGRRRLACSGDSFTLGYGVRDRETWCALLGGPGSGYEPVNLGQGGYGLDQSFLWWRRMAPAVRAHLHLFTVNQYLLDRMARRDHGGYGKPMLARGAEGSLEVRNVPVPGVPFLHPLLPAARRAARDLRLSRLVRRVGGTAEPVTSAQPVDWAPVVEQVFAELRALDASHGTETRIVYLPRSGDAVHDSSLPWRVATAAAAARARLPWHDLVPALRELPRDAAASLFVSTASGRYSGAAGHYSVAGNEWVAARLLEILAR